MEREEKCWSCYWYERVGVQETHGYCHKRSPESHPDGAAWPCVARHDFCGEWLHMEWKREMLERGGGVFRGGGPHSG